ncbi:dihydrolipoamide dehydrogenase [Pontibacillus halophilus JSM 076056 = DSM 19796]|uniref:Dihydrolipoyl dehydrogenase n=1 Tax=Pontibacillus halophilus JSM 076056 = DSM 19796 TaxID=1385510 RepID=A0A0A5I529_9BACI|nr:dihydrolipoyl dehydrogenase [Pontibacillus halophilus]KGX90932.1 dihydrolipoamide dehydrogenase [Pontibacillus halophilus JSM 076056 = DSM 19796]
MAEEYDLVVLGGGTGGYVAAVRASQLGLTVAIVEKDKLGGTCLHRGCIPSKALLRSAEVFKVTQEAEQYGVETASPTLNFFKVQERKQSIVDSLHKGVQGLMKKGKIDVYEGYGRILGPSIFSPTAGTISVEYANGDENTMLIPKNVLIATGSKPRTLGMEVDGQLVMTSDEALQMEELPESIMIVGGGVIGIEWASMLSDFGVEVTVLEYSKRILPTEDHEVAKEMTRLMKNKGVNIVTDAKVDPQSLVKENGVKVTAEQNGDNVTYTADRMLISVGRSPNVTNIGLENTDIVVEKDAIATNKFYQTKESHIYAIGDVIGGMQLAHVASHEGITAVEHMADQQPHPLDMNNVPSCIYSSPEVASVGLTEEEAKEQGYTIKVGKFPFKAIGKALVFGESDGFVKIVADEDTDDLLGVHMIGPHVTDMISEAGLAKVLDATPWEIGQTIHPHPTLSEAMGEAALAVEGNQIHG